MRNPPIYVDRLYRLSYWLTWPHNGMVLENTQFEFFQQNILILPFGSEFSPGSRDVIKNSIRPFSIGLLRFFKCSWKIRNFSLFRKNIWTLPFCSEFPPVPEFLLKIQSDPFSYGYSVISNVLGKNAIWVYVEKYFNIAI